MLIKKIESLFKHNFVKDTATLQVGTFVSIGLSFIASVIFARFLGPENYGQYVLVFAFVSLVGVFMNWGINYAILTLLADAWTRRDKQETKEIIIYFLKISLLITAGVSIIAIIFAPLISKLLYQNLEIGKLARWVLLAGIIQIAFFLLTIILQVVRKIKHLTIIENLNKIIYIIIPIILVLMSYGLRGIVWGHFLSALIFLIISIYFYNLLLKKTHLLPNFKEIFYGLKNVSIKKYFKFGFLIAVDKNLSSLYTILPMVFLGMFVKSAEVAYYKIAFSYIGLSLMFLKPISRLLTVQLPKSKIYGHSELKTHFFKTAFYSFIITAIVIIPMLILARYLIEIFYGIKYLPSLNLIYMLWPYVLILSGGVGLGPIFRTINKMKVVIKIHLVNLIIGTPIFYLLIKNYGLIGAVITSTVWVSITMLATFIYIKKYFKNAGV